MTRLLLTTSLFFLLFAGVSFAQDDMMNIIPPENTKNPEQQQQWIEGQNAFPAKPKSMWELGIHGGHSMVIGDVDAPFFSGVGFGIDVRKALSYTLSLRLSGQYTSSSGFDANATSFNQFRQEYSFRQNGGINGPLGGYEGSVIYRNYETTMFGGQLELLVNIGNILFHNPEPKWNAYIGAGLGFHSRETELDLLDGTSGLYDFESIRNRGDDLSTASGRKDARDALMDILDGDHETVGGEDPSASDDGLHGTLSFGISRKLGGRVSIGLDNQFLFSGSDLMDGFQAGSKSADLNMYTSIRIVFQLGNKSKRTQPLNWVNPLQAPMNDVAELKQRPKFDLTDSDGDGVIDMIDQEPDSPAGAPVDTRGIVLDSDSDGVPDYQDQEPYSPPGYDVNAEGVAQGVPQPLTEQQVRAWIDAKPAPQMSWFLPMIHFDLDKYYIKPEYYGRLHNVAAVAKNHPNLKIVAKGYSDNRGTEEYNNVLSYNRAEAAVNYIVDNYGVPRDRFLIQYAGQSNPLVNGLPSNYSTSYEEEKAQYMNRRVEFMLAGSNDQEMARPEGEAGSNTPGSARQGAKYSGNRNSGY